MKLLKTLFLILFCAHTVLAQPGIPSQLADSLWQVWQDDTQQDTTRLKAIYDYAWDGYLFTQPDSAYYYSQLQYDFAKARDLKKPMANALNTQGVSLYLRNEYSKAIEHYSLSMKIMEDIGNTHGVASILGNIGDIYRVKGDYARAIVDYSRSLKLLETTGDKVGIGLSLSNIGSVYFEQGDYNSALTYYARSLDIAEQIGDKRGILRSLGNIGNSYKHLGNITEALDSYSQSLKIAEEIGDKTGISTSLNNIGLVYREQGDYANALDYCRRSLAIDEEIGDKIAMTSSLNSIGNLYADQGDYIKALDFSRRSVQIAQEIGAVRQTRNAAKSLWELHKKLGNYQQSLKMYELFVQMRDSIESEENQKEIISQQYKYAYEKQAATDSISNAKAAEIKNAHIAQQQAEIKAKKNQQYGLFGGLGLMFLLAAVFFTQRNRISSEKERSESLLLNILPEEVADELKTKGEAEATLIEHVTVLFTDFKGFTRMSENVTPKALVKDLHECFSAFDHICEKYSIEKIKTIGDAYMAAGGLPTPNQTHAKDVVQAALEMAEVVEKGKAKKIAEALPFFEIRVGVHTGPVVAGIVGVKKFQYDIWGDTVNIASRMESSGEVGKVNISQCTYDLLKDDADFAYESRGKIKAKGKGEVDMYFVSIA